MFCNHKAYWTYHTYYIRFFVQLVVILEISPSENMLKEYWDVSKVVIF